MIRCPADQGKERAQGHGGRLEARMLPVPAQTIAKLKAPPKRIALVERWALRLLLEMNRALAPITSKAKI